VPILITVLRPLREKLNHNAVLMQLPIGAEENFAGVVDLVTKKAWYFDGDNGENVRIEDVQLIWLIKWKKKEQLCLMLFLSLMMK
jgi:translation elongation factor EF-G